MRLKKRRRANVLLPEMNETSCAFVSRMKVLVVDDEPSNVALFEDVLAEGGYTRISSLSDARQAAEVCRTFEPDLVLLDLMMPHVDGFAVLEALRSRTVDPHVPVIILTADTNEQTKRRALAAGATDFLYKPFDYMEVLLRIKNLLESRRMQQQLENQRAAFEEAVLLRSEEVRDLRAQIA